MWPFAERVYVFTDATSEDVAHWTLPPQADAIEEGFANTIYGPELRHGDKAR